MFKLLNARQAALGLVVTLFISASAFAQSTILVVDQQRVLRESAVGKHIEAQVKAIASSMESEVKAKTSNLTPERDRLVAELKNMSPEALKGRPDLQQRAQSLVKKGQEAELDARYKAQELRLTEGKAVQKVNERLGTILKAIVAERGADIVLDRSIVIYTGSAADITTTVISRLDQQLRTVPVVRERLPRQ